MTPSLFKVRKPAPVACLTVNGAVKFIGSWALAQIEKRKYMYGRVELHAQRRATGECLCSRCTVLTDRPYLNTYNDVDYWKCDECGHINWIRK